MLGRVAVAGEERDTTIAKHVRHPGEEEGGGTLQGARSSRVRRGWG